MKQALSLLLALSLILAGCKSGLTGSSPRSSDSKTYTDSVMCPDLGATPDGWRFLKEASDTLPFIVVLPCNRKFTLTYVAVVIPPGVSRQGMPETIKYVRLNFRVDGGGGFSLLESNGNIALDGDRYTLAGHDVIFAQNGDNLSLWVDTGSVQVVLGSDTLARKDLEEIAKDLLQ